MATQLAFNGPVLWWVLVTLSRTGAVEDELTTACRVAIEAACVYQHDNATEDTASQVTQFCRRCNAAKMLEQCMNAPDALLKYGGATCENIHCQDQYVYNVW